MNIEQSIAELIAAVKENTAALHILSNKAAEPKAATPETPAAEPAKKRTKKATTPKPEAPAAEEEEENTDSTPDVPVAGVPELPLPELRASLKELIKAKMFADPAAKDVFATLRTKYEIKLIAELTDEQVPEFYKEVLSW